MISCIDVVRRHWSTRVGDTVLLRLLRDMLLFSCAVTVFLTVLQLRRDCRRGTELVIERLDQIHGSAGHSLSEALWRLDRTQLELELDGILQFPDICSASASENEAYADATRFSVTSGECAPGPVISRDYPLVYRIDGRHERRIGTLHVVATLSNLFRALRRTVLDTLANQATHTFLVSLFATVLCRLLVTRHLASIARSVSSYDYREPPQPLLLHRVPAGRRNELDEVASAFNAMSMRLYNAYRDEHAAAAEREARRVAEAANRAKGAILADMSHELRAPLNGILGYVQLLAGDASLDSRQRSHVAAIRRSGEHLLSLIDDILDFARIEAAKLKLEIRDVQLSALLASVSEVILIKATQKGTHFRYTIAADTPCNVRADEKRLRQVLLNLLDNAVKFTDSGAIALRVTGAARDAVRFDVSDTGIGIPADQLTAIFEPFQQVQGIAPRAGAGLGLAISRELVRAMGGDIALESAVGQGSTFSFELPAAASAPLSSVEQCHGAPITSDRDSDGAHDDAYVVPDDELDALVALARQGDMSGIQRWADRVASRNVQYRPFADRIRELAASFQSARITRLVERQLARSET
ncbi:hypothetical protein WS90_25080 [Burkholderia cepacia]|uniref:Virulence sensor protein BvgS n=1 Tax=Burkholderia cepacia TaxID=292 RepID=A0A103Z9X4_BURCE|nr:ATP-binding protein [Burkholderia cepacia]KVK75926.1 hypothetical protein WS90_25080 [Burkholderia cepacia]